MKTWVVLLVLLGVPACSDVVRPPGDSGVPGETGSILDTGVADTGCPPDACADLGSPEVWDGGRDTGFDVGPMCDGRTLGTPSRMYGPCLSDRDCPSWGLTCLTEAASGWPGGFCTGDCVSDDECYTESPPRDGYCYADPRTRRRWCVPTCIHGEDCGRAGFTCFPFTTTYGMDQACLPVCTATSCSAGFRCDADRGRCVPDGTDPCTARPDAGMPVGAALGQACSPMAADGDRAHCLSDRCLPASTPDSSGQPIYSGWNGGYCTSYCILPPGYNNTRFWMDGRTPLPQANCPTGGICLPTSELTAGDLGTCLAGCITNSDCRAPEGYYCRRTITINPAGTIVFPNGWCTPINCANSTTPCPAGYSCRINPSTRVGVCVPTG